MNGMWYQRIGVVAAAALLCVCSGCAADGQPTEATTVTTTVTTATTTTAPTTTTTKMDLTVWNLILVNPWHSVSEDFTVELREIGGGHAVDARIYDDLQAMLTAARDEGLAPKVRSSYRSHATQKVLHQNRINRCLNQGYSLEEAKIEAAKWVAVPGTSEHELGLALDIVATSYQELNRKQEETAEQQWLMANSWRFGFILRYPNEKSEITGIYYEPWHYRYVGKEAAREIYESGMCLEEYLESKR